MGKISNKTNNNKGFTLVEVLLLIVVLILVGGLGYIGYKQVNKKSTTSTATTTTNATNNTSVTKEITYNTYTTDKYNISFKYPSSWSIDEKKSGDDSIYYNRNVEIKNADGEVIAHFVVGMQLGGTCDTPSNYTVIDSVETKFQSYKPTSLSFTVIENEGGGYGVHYGLSDEYTALGATGKVCSNTFYYYFGPRKNDIHGISFGDSVTGGLKKFSSINDAKKYVNSDEYKEIKKMILSLNY